MLKVAIFLALFLVGTIITPPLGSAQCSSRIALTDSTYIHCGGVNYTDCVVNLHVDSIGLWVNDTLIVPFISYVDRLSIELKQRYRDSVIYRQALANGLEDHDALTVVTVAEGQLYFELEHAVFGIDSKIEFDSRAHSIVADSLALAFELEINWHQGGPTKGYVRFRTSIEEEWSGIGSIGRPPRAEFQSSRIWDQELPRLMKRYCKQLLQAERMINMERSGRFDAVRVGRVSGHATAFTREQLLDMLKSY